MNYSDPDVPDWFWDAIDAAGYRLDVLRAWLMEQPKEVLQRFGHAYIVAPWDLFDGYGSELWVDGHRMTWENVQDVCTWAVGQGKAFCQRIDDGELSPADIPEARPTSRPARPR